MTAYSSIKDFINALSIEKSNNTGYPIVYKNNAEPINDELISLLELLENINPCEQEYDFHEDCIVISYTLKLNLFNFLNIFPLYIKTKIIGLPISLSTKGYWGNPLTVKAIIKSKKGLKIILNGDESLGLKGRTLSTFIFNNIFSSFEEYLNSLRSSYRRRIKKALEHREDLIIRRLDPCNFSYKHYSLYLSIMKRTDNPLETLPFEFFTNYDSEIYEFLDKETQRVLAFVQLKEFEDSLYFMFCGFNKEDNEKYDLYYNMLIKILEIGIEKKVKTINYGQTSEESKLKLGCKEVPMYLGVNHSNVVLDRIFQLLLPLFSYRPYKVKHNVFKNSCKSGRSK